MKTFSRTVAIAALLGGSVAAIPVANAAIIQLGFILDRSSSIGSGNWTTIVDGLAGGINTIPVTGANQYEISVVAFESSASTAVNRVLLTDSTVRSNVAAAVSSIPFTGGGTNFAAAFGEMLDTLTAGGATLLDSTYLNFATDGQGTSGVSERNALIAAGVDNISIEGIGSGVDVVDLTTNYCYPTPCDTTMPFNFPSQGFYIGVADAAGYAAAIGNKVATVTGQIPEPATLALLGLGLGLAAARKRKQ